MKNWEKYKIGVFGSAGGGQIEKNKLGARIIGEGIAINDGIVCTGACPGLPHEVALSADKNGGIVLGFSPAVNHNEHVLNYDLPFGPYILNFTGMGFKGRNLFCTRSCDAGIFISGRWGTVNEFTLMYDEGIDKVIGLLAGSGGYVDEIIIPSLQNSEKSTAAIIVIDNNPKELVARVFEQLDNIKKD